MKKYQLLLIKYLDSKRKRQILLVYKKPHTDHKNNDLR